MSNKYNGILQSANDIVTFLLELLMFVAFGCFGYNVPASIGLRIGLAAGLVTVAVILWAFFRILIGTPNWGARYRRGGSRHPSHQLPEVSLAYPRAM
jgi:Protein of unknown function (DUF2568)